MNESIIVSDDWLNSNLYKVEFYLENDDGSYQVYLLNIEDPTEETFDDLIETFYTTPYSNYNSYRLQDGVNCQGMVSYIAKWCELNGVDYEVQYTSTHTYIVVNYQENQYEFDFSKAPTVKSW